MHKDYVRVQTYLEVGKALRDFSQLDARRTLSMTGVSMADAVAVTSHLTHGRVTSSSSSYQQGIDARARW